MLSDLCREDPECKDAVADLLRDAIPEMTAVFVPPNWDLDYVRVFGFEIEDIYKEGMQSLETKLRSAGIPLEELPGPMPIPLDKSYEERARQRHRPAARRHLRREERAAVARPRGRRAAVRPGAAARSTRATRRRIR